MLLLRPQTTVHAMQAAVPRNGYLRAEEPEDHIVHIRTYDLLISYDKYYSVPKFWLVGYDESKQPLPTKQVHPCLLSQLCEGFDAVWVLLRCMLCTDITWNMHGTRNWTTMTLQVTVYICYWSQTAMSPDIVNLCNRF